MGTEKSEKDFFHFLFFKYFPFRVDRCDPWFLLPLPFPR